MESEPSESQHPDGRVLLLPPTTRDAQAIAKMLADAGICARICPTLQSLCQELNDGAGAVVIAEEILTAHPDPLLMYTREQPFWSDLPLVVLARSGVEPPKLAAILPRLGNVTVLERPVRMTTMLSLVRSCLRGRERQYQMRDHLAELRRADEHLRESEERLRLAVETGRLGVWELDLQTNAMQCSALCKSNYGRGSEDSFNYADLWACVHADDIDRVRNAVRDAISGVRDYETEYRCVWPDGTIHWVLVRGRASTAAGGKTRRLIGVTLDITERKTAEEERTALLESERIARANAERAGRMKDEFLATLSHELRTPLNAILGWSQILATNTGDPDDLSEGLRTIERNARAQTQIIEDLLDMSRIISGKVRLDVQRVSLLAVVQAAVDTVKPTADAKGVRLQVVLDPKAGLVSGDPNRLQQVFWNLLTNAIKFTPRNARVQVLLERVNSDLEVSVIDSGEGIAAEFLPYVFDRFRQADASTTRRHGGLGLGLAIVKQLVELHGGRVRAQSAGLGKGATFIVTLPVTVVHSEDEPADRRHPRATNGIAVPVDSADDIAGIRVLVLDDEQDSRELVVRLLQDRKAIAFSAATATQALELIKAERPDVIISDIGMPGEDGYAFIRRVRILPPENGGQTPAVALTAYARAEDRVAAARAGFQQHITKPVEPAELIAVIASLSRR